MAAESEMTMRSVEGVVGLRRSQSGTNCICCDGPHIFGVFLTCDDDAPKQLRHRDQASRPTDHLDWSRFVWDAVRDMPEGQRVRITVEAI